MQPGGRRCGSGVASGAAAITYTIQELARPATTSFLQKTIYGGSYNLLEHTLPQFGITTTFVDAHDLKRFEAAAIQDNTKAVYLETLGNPNSDIVISRLSQKSHTSTVCRWLSITPSQLRTCIRPIEYGADIVVHSATKFIGGHGTTLGGVIVDSGKFDWKASGKLSLTAEPNPSYHGISFTEAAGPAAFVTKVRAILLRDTGATISPFNAFLLLQGLETLSLRVERHVENALKVVEFLKPPQVEKVNHPSLPDPATRRCTRSTSPTAALPSSPSRSRAAVRKHKFIDNLELFSLLANVADVKSLVIHPASTTHSQLTERSCRAGNQPEHHPPVHRHRAHRRHHRRPRAGFAAVRGE